MTLRLSDGDHEALRKRAEEEGISMQEAVRRAVRSYVEQAEHRERVDHAATLIMSVHADALRRLGE